ncbi:NTP transferase domain-containing protein [Pseudarthrobacter cellobiosi]|uniref:NTP transferase domain-containing protein n=1 Tax=Pseudarthrobacter cellobiosi TaxID=2953654 RepID=UPI00208DE997|nr:NTP transferase domain-containing protein [Pseudarthrobacter sp. HLT1-5]MCO4254997.1 NTP transferase domain-containing protein [Pseudarthrobacter sp. HLT1-5]
MDADPLDFDAVILAGGRSSRLGGVPKQSLTYDGDSLLRRSAAAAGGARAAVVVGPDAGEVPAGEIPAGFLRCREEPPFSGPAAAIAAGLAALAAAGGSRPGLTLVLACDMPNVEQAVVALKAALRARARGAGGPAAGGPAAGEPAAGGHSAGQPAGLGPDGVVAVSEDGRRQPLVGFYSTVALQRSVAELERTGRLINGSGRALLASLDVQLVAVPAGSTADVDTWDDAAALGVAGPDPITGLRGNTAADDLGGRA